MAGIIPTIASIALTPAELAAGFSFNPTGSGVSLLALTQEAFLDLESALVKLQALAAALPAGANQTTVNAQITALLTASGAIALALDGGAASTSFSLPGYDGGSASSTYSASPISGGTA